MLVHVSRDVCRTHHASCRIHLCGCCCRCCRLPIVTAAALATPLAHGPVSQLCCAYDAVTITQINHSTHSLHCIALDSAQPHPTLDSTRSGRTAAAAV